MPSTQADGELTPSDEQEALLLRAVELLNGGEFDALVELLHPEVDWPDLAADALLAGRDAVRDYWERVTRAVRPELTPLEMTRVGEDVVMVSRQRTFERESDSEMVPALVISQRFSFRDGLISRMRVARSHEGGSLDVPVE